MNWRSLNSGREFFSDSMEGITQKPLLDSKCSFDASTSLVNTASSLRNKEKDKSASDVSKDLTGRRSSSNAALIVLSRRGDEDVTVKQHLEFMKDADSAAGPSTIRPDTIRPVEKKPHASHLCPKTFKEKSHLVSHRQTHTGEKPFVCDICGKEFSRKASLGKHYRRHTGEKSYECNICGKAFSDRSTLTKHAQTHEGAKRYKCGVCGKTFSRNDSRSKHYKEQHQ
ncbi:Zinc finger protein 888 [Araneus ventricosus]|uniref:Zinc finger protein 888 n=1 Tax=Araneus ventricosus TaxID=182803 RepID=A0A4Y2M6N2_ARAVE|nr:Zinc finger protein 888 [Araneus ventricosus]